MKLEFSRKILRKILEYQIFMNIRQVGTQLLCEDKRTDRQTEKAKRIFAIRSFENAPKNCAVLKSAPVDMSIGVSRETDSFVCLSVRLSICNNSSRTGRIFVKVVTLSIFLKSV